MEQGQYLKFFTATNLVDSNVIESHPWLHDPDGLGSLKAMDKADRRAHILKPETKWNIYSAVRGFNKNARISSKNPASGLRGLVADYDMVTDITTVFKYLGQIPENSRPNFIETSLSDKIRLVWVFERELLIPSSEFCEELIARFFDKLGVPTLLAGYDRNSTKPAEMWTNGGIWQSANPNPLSWEYCFGVVCEVSKKTSLFNHGEIPLEIIAEEVKKRFPNRWQGEFKIDALGVRFWDESADNETGCQVKPDGMLCFTGKEPFMKWELIFGRAWCEEQKCLNLGRAASDIYFDGKKYWEKNNGRWENVMRADIILRLKGRGLSDKCPKGATQSDVERVLDHLQRVNRVQGAAPLINYRAGIVDYEGRRILNIAELHPVQPIAGTGDPTKDFPWLWKFLNGFFPRPELKPLDHYHAWLQRAYRAALNYERYMGQALFICGSQEQRKNTALPTHH